MAPETILYNQYSEKSDIWALGVVLYEMLHGFPPYKAPSDSSLLNLYLTTPVSFTQSTSLPNEVKKLISNMLMLDHNHRY
jgi:serine/threonine-protein kinase ULK/ATG1